ncbi:MAG: efflux transporter outer membrane subunit [Gallionellaceae bacterium]|nr:MAG: efflux transporter outer membrane subunit [Gallionellaceae bacterium]
MSKRFIWAACAAFALAGCAVGPDYKRPDTPQPQWHGALPHGGKLDGLEQWWEQLNDPLLGALIVKAEESSPSINMALARMNEARANATIGGAGQYPSLVLGAGAARSRSAFGMQVMEQSVGKVGFDASWEIDLFGKNRRTAEAAQARFGAGEAGWHDARISLAAEVADVYVELRQCEAALSIAERNRQSRAAVREVTRIKEGAGLASPMDAARALAGEAESDSAYIAKQGECARAVNRLTALTGIEQNSLKARLAARQGQIPLANFVDVSSVAAQVLSQRPDVAMAEANLAAASADIGVSKAALYPSLTLVGSVASNVIYLGGQSTQVPTWSFGPSLSLPLFTGGRGQAGVKAAQARYDYALANYQKTVREAVRNVEDALVRLNVANARAHDGDKMQEKYRQLFQATEARFNAGLGNRVSLEEARRNWLQAQDAAVAMDRETVSAWIALYKALGGGWERAARPGKLADNSNSQK